AAPRRLPALRWQCSCAIVQSGAEQRHASVHTAGASPPAKFPARRASGMAALPAQHRPGIAWRKSILQPRRHAAARIAPSALGWTFDREPAPIGTVPAWLLAPGDVAPQLFPARSIETRGLQT